MKDYIQDNQKAWDNEYRDSVLVSKDWEPQSFIKRFLKWYKKTGKELGSDSCVLDMGCGIGRNLLHVADKYACGGLGIDFSDTAIEIARTRAQELCLSKSVQFKVLSMSQRLELDDESCDIIFDAMASHALPMDELEKYLREMQRALASDGVFLVRTLYKPGDVNAGKLLKQFPGSEPNTYRHPDIEGLVERVYTQETYSETFGKYFDVAYTTIEEGYQGYRNQSYKRRYLVTYLTKA